MIHTRYHHSRKSHAAFKLCGSNFYRIRLIAHQRFTLQDHWIRNRKHHIILLLWPWSNNLHKGTWPISPEVVRADWIWTFCVKAFKSNRIIRFIHITYIRKQQTVAMWICHLWQYYSKLLLATQRSRYLIPQWGTAQGKNAPRGCD